MKKYRVVKAYWSFGVTLPVGTVLSFPEDLDKWAEDHRTALSLGALEEVKAWEPKDWERVFYVFIDFAESEIVRACYRSSTEKANLEKGLIYPTREQAEECLWRMLETAKKYKEEVLGG